MPWLMCAPCQLPDPVISHTAVWCLTKMAGCHLNAAASSHTLCHLGGVHGAAVLMLQLCAPSAPEGLSSSCALLALQLKRRVVAAERDVKQAKVSLARSSTAARPGAATRQALLTGGPPAIISTRCMLQHEISDQHFTSA